MTFYLICLLVLTICFQFSTPLPDRGSRFRRHADGLFASELSKMKNDVAMRSYLRSLLTSKRSVPEINFPKDAEEYEARFEEVCFNWLYQSFLIKSLAEKDALKATQESSKLICRPLGHFIFKIKEYIPLDQPLDIKE